MSQLESGAIDLEPEPLSASQVVADRVDALSSRAEQQDVALSFDPADAEAPARLDRDATKRIVDELLRNAIDFSEAGDRAHVEVEHRPDYVRIVVEDTGIGMDEERLEELLRPFEQASVGHKRTHEGTGLGLTVVHHLVHLMDGSIDIESERGRGTRVAVRLPHRLATAPSTREPVAGEDRTLFARQA